MASDLTPTLAPPTLTPAMGGAAGEASVSAVSWPAILAGAVVAMAVTLILLTLGAGLGAAAVSPWPGVGPKATSFTLMTGLWLIVTQWLSAGIGAYLTGRLRTKWAGTHTHEVFFRDTAHGFLTWALASVVVAGVASFAAGPAGDAAAHAAAAVDTASVDAARKAAATLSIFTALSMLVGAFIACVAAALGGQQRDEHI